MIYLTIALGAAGGVIVILAIIAINAIRQNSRLEREKAYDRDATDEARRQVEKLKAENITMLQQISYFKEENADLSKALRELEARNTALVEAMEAKPTQPAKRTMRKNTTAGEQQ